MIIPLLSESIEDELKADQADFKRKTIKKGAEDDITWQTEGKNEEDEPCLSEPVALGDKDNEQTDHFRLPQKMISKHIIAYTSSYNQSKS